MPNSRYPKNSLTAKRELVDFLDSNGLDTRTGLTSEEDIFAAWTALVEQDSSVMIEKSPHHLYQPSNIALMERYADAMAGRVDVRFVGLIRNPMDTIYSSWRRFGVSPHVEEAHWISAYRRLRDLKDRRRQSVTLVRYEDCVDGSFDPSVLGLPVVGVPSDEPLRTNSLGKWRQDRTFGFALSKDAHTLALDYGYAEADLLNANSGFWAHRRLPRAAAYQAITLLPERVERGLRDTAKTLLKKTKPSVRNGGSALQS